MTPLQWQDAPQQAEPQKRQSASVDMRDAPQKNANPWFIISILLIGLIAGFWFGKSRATQRSLALGTPPVQIAAPVPKAPVLAKAKTIQMTAELWKFTPNIITVKQGERIALAITGVSGTHGIAIPGLGINETIIQGNTVSVNIPTDKTGTFDFACSIQCGSGHNDMTGKIIVQA